MRFKAELREYLPGKSDKQFLGSEAEDIIEHPCKNCAVDSVRCNAFAKQRVSPP